MIRWVGALFAALLVACTSLKPDLPASDDAGANAEAGPGVVQPNDAGDAADAGDPADAGADADAADATADADDAYDATTDASDAADSEGGSNVDSGNPCSPLDLSVSDFYVDANAIGTGSGAPGCPFPTITAAGEAAARSSALAKTIHIAAGVYDENHESFPIDLRNGISLIGAGSAVTTIQGWGHVVSSGYWREFYATISLGNADTTTTLRGLRILPGPNTVPNESMGVFCSAGNVTFPGTTPPPNSLLDDLVVGPGFFSDVKLVGTDHACNMRITRSQIIGQAPVASLSIGAFVAGAGCGGYAQGALPLPVALQLGDGTAAGGNTFSGFQASDAGFAVLLQGCMTSFSATNNVIQDSNIGMMLVTTSSPAEPKPTITMTNNTFRRLSGKSAAFQPNQYVLVGGALIEAPGSNVVDFSGNTFSEIRAPNGQPPVPALLIGALSSNSSFPATFHARNNQFVGNDIGVRIQTNGANVLTAASLLDFGTSGNGNNTFRCNAHTAADPGSDVLLDTATDGTATVSLSGNAWDRASPSVVTSATLTDGTDVALVRSANPKVDTSSASLSSLQCPGGFTP